MLRPVQALCSSKSLVTTDRGVVKYKVTHIGASTASRLRTKLAIDLSYATYRRSQEMLDIRSGDCRDVLQWWHSWACEIRSCCAEQKLSHGKRTALFCVRARKHPTCLCAGQHFAHP